MPPWAKPPTFGEILQTAEEVAANYLAAYEKLPANAGGRKKRDIIRNPNMNLKKGHQNPRKKREGGDHTEAICSSFGQAYTILQSMKDGAMFSPAKWVDNPEVDEAKEMLKGATAAQIASCFDLDPNIALYTNTGKFLAKKLSSWVAVKKYSDGFDITSSTDCELPGKSSECGCECEKQNKVKIHKMFKILSILDHYKISQLGDVLEWFFRGFLKVSPRIYANWSVFKCALHVLSDSKTDTVHVTVDSDTTHN